MKEQIKLDLKRVIHRLLHLRDDFTGRESR